MNRPERKDRTMKNRYRVTFHDWAVCELHVEAAHADEAIALAQEQVYRDGPDIARVRNTGTDSWEAEPAA